VGEGGEEFARALFVAGGIGDGTDGFVRESKIDCTADADWTRGARGGSSGNGFSAGLRSPDVLGERFRAYCIVNDCRLGGLGAGMATSDDAGREIDGATLPVGCGDGKEGPEDGGCGRRNG
jgi:hypothetical protein